MSNPLVTVETLTLEQPLDVNNALQENSGKLVLKFYVRGSSKTDATYLRESFDKSRTELATAIADKIKECEKNSCVSLVAYQDLQKKFNQFNASVTSALSKDGNNVETIYVIGQQLGSLQSLKKEFENIK